MRWSTCPPSSALFAGKVRDDDRQKEAPKLLR